MKPEPDGPNPLRSTEIIVPARQAKALRDHAMRADLRAIPTTIDVAIPPGSALVNCGREPLVARIRAGAATELEPQATFGWAFGAMLGAALVVALLLIGALALFSRR